MADHSSPGPLDLHQLLLFCGAVCGNKCLGHSRQELYHWAILMALHWGILGRGSVIASPLTSSLGGGAIDKKAIHPQPLTEGFKASSLLLSHTHQPFTGNTIYVKPYWDIWASIYPFVIRCKFHSFYIYFTIPPKYKRQYRNEEMIPINSFNPGLTAQWSFIIWWSPPEGGCFLSSPCLH